MNFSCPLFSSYKRTKFEQIKLVVIVIFETFIWQGKNELLLGPKLHFFKPCVVVGLHLSCDLTGGISGQTSFAIRIENVAKERLILEWKCKCIEYWSFFRSRATEMTENHSPIYATLKSNYSGKFYWIDNLPHWTEADGPFVLVPLASVWAAAVVVVAFVDATEIASALESDVGINIGSKVNSFISIDLNHWLEEDWNLLNLVDINFDT